MKKPKSHTVNVRGDALLAARIDVNKFMEGTVSEITKFGQMFFREEADKFFPAGCNCSDDSGSCDWCCDWCQVYYGYDKPWIDEEGRAFQ